LKIACGFAKEEDCILVFVNPFSLSETKVMKMPSNKYLELLDFKSILILKMEFDAPSSVPGTYDMINFWPSLPCKIFPE